jgi:hypothetical protein
MVQTQTHAVIAIWFLTKEPKIHSNSKIVYSTSGTGKTGYSHVEDWNYIPVSPCTSINSKWVTDLNVRSATVKLLQERVGQTLEHIGIGHKFFNRSSIAQQLIEKWLTSGFASNQKTSEQQRKQSLDWRDGL